MIYKEIIKLSRHLRYLNEKDSDHGVLHYGSEDELYKMNPCCIYDSQKEESETAYRLLLHKAMHNALKDLEKINLDWYQLVCDYYLCENKVTFTYLAEKYDRKRQSISRSLKRAVKVLRQLSEEHLEKLMNE